MISRIWGRRLASRSSMKPTPTFFAVRATILPKSRKACTDVKLSGFRMSLASRYCTRSRGAPSAYLAVSDAAGTDGWTLAVALAVLVALAALAFLPFFFSFSLPFAMTFFPTSLSLADAVRQLCVLVILRARRRPGYCQIYQWARLGSRPHFDVVWLESMLSSSLLEL